MDAATITALGFLFTGLASVLGAVYKLLQLRLIRIEHLVNSSHEELKQDLKDSQLLNIDLREKRRNDLD